MNLYQYYITLREDGAILRGFSSAFEEPGAEDVLALKGDGMQFRLFEDGMENQPLIDQDGIPMYRWDGQAIVERTWDEIEAERAALPPMPEPMLERLARAMMPAISVQLDDAAVLTIQDAPWPVWVPGQAYTENAVVSHGGQTYRIVKAHTSQPHQQPGGEGMLAIYRPIVSKATGTQDDPIPFVYGMDVEEGKCYSWEGAVYTSDRDVTACVYYPGQAGVHFWLTT